MRVSSIFKLEMTLTREMTGCASSTGKDATCRKIAVDTKSDPKKFFLRFDMNVRSPTIYGFLESVRDDLDDRRILVPFCCGKINGRLARCPFFHIKRLELLARSPNDMANIGG